MATTQTLSSSTWTVKLWENKTWADKIHMSPVGMYFAEGVINESDKVTRSSRGDRVTISWTAILTGLGTTEGAYLESNTEALNISTEDFVINLLRHAVTSPNDGTIEQIRTNVNFEEQARYKLPQHLIGRHEMGFNIQAAGSLATSVTVDGATYTGGYLPIVRGFNTVTEPTTNRIIRAGGAANDQSLTSADTATPDLLEQLVAKLKVGYPYFESMKNDRLLWIVPPSVSRDLRLDTTGRIQFYQMSLAQMAGGKTDTIYANNGFSMKPIGSYLNIDIYESTRVPQGVNSSTFAPVSNTYRTLVLGKNACIFGSPHGSVTGYGDPKKINAPFMFVDQLSDFTYYLGVGYQTVYGYRKLKFQNEDLGCAVISVYSAA